MFIECKKDYNPVLWMNFKKGDRMPIIAIHQDSYSFENPDGTMGQIAKYFLFNDSKNYLELKKEKHCNHDKSNIIDVFDYKLCDKCSEIISCERE